MITKVAGGYRIVSHRTGQNLGTFPTRAAAQRRLAQLARFREAAACRWVAAGGRTVCIAEGHGGHAPAGRRRRRALPADVGTSGIGTHSNTAST
jgi:hypothetical protein